MSRPLSAKCPNCHSIQTVRAPNNELICVDCGAEIDGSLLVSDVTFSETASGAPAVAGSFLGADQTHISSSIRIQGGRTQGGQGESRAQTLEKTKRRMTSISVILNIPEHVSSSALSFFKVALDNGFVKGRRSQYVVSACLYLACRQNKTQHMLMDFAEVICVNVFAIGATYLQLVRSIGANEIKIPLTDPTLFVQRFTMALEFGESEKQVRDDAAKVVARMGKDWLVQGRRPAGIAAAAVIIAARMNNFRRSKLEVVQIAKIAEETVQRRLDEFKNTAAGKLTITEFRNTDIENHGDPPSFGSKDKAKEESKQKMRAAHDKLIKKSMEEDDLNDVYLNDELVRMADEIRQLEEEEKREYLRLKEQQKQQEQEKLKASESTPGGSEYVIHEKEEGGLEHDVDVILEDPSFKRATQAEIFLKKYRAEKEQRKKQEKEALESAELAAVNASRYDSWVSKVSDDPDNLSDVSDDEIDSFILSKEEADLKRRVWMTLNADYLIEEEKRRLKREADIASGVYKPKKRRKPRNANNQHDQNDHNDHANGHNIGDNAESNPQVAMPAPQVRTSKLNHTVMDLLLSKNS